MKKQVERKPNGLWVVRNTRVTNVALVAGIAISAGLVGLVLHHFGVETVEAVLKTVFGTGIAGVVIFGSKLWKARRDYDHAVNGHATEVLEQSKDIRKSSFEEFRDCKAKLASISHCCKVLRDDVMAEGYLEMLLEAAELEDELSRLSKPALIL